MPHARRTALLAAALLLPLARAAAQPAFEGVITVRIRSEGAPAPAEMQYFIRQGMMRTEVAANGMRAVSIADPAKRTLYMLVPGQRMYMQMSMPDERGADTGPGGRAPRVTRTGRRETVAGHACEHYLVQVDTTSMDACIATDLPAYMAPRGGGMGGGDPRGARGDQWMRGLGGAGGFPLKVTRAGASVPLMEVTRIEPRKLDAALFAPPSDYQRMTIPGGVPRRP